MMPGNRRKACGANSGGAIAPADKAYRKHHLKPLVCKDQRFSFTHGYRKDRQNEKALYL